MDLLAEHKVLYLPHLRQVNIMERVEGQLGNTLWELPKRMKPVVDSGGIDLKIWIGTNTNQS